MGRHMKKVCAMAGVIFNPEKPLQSIRELRAAGISEVMFDFGLFASSERILMDRGKQKTDFQPDLVKKSFDLVMEQFMEHEFLPSIARLPFVYTGANYIQEHRYEEWNRLLLRLALDSIKVCEKMGCNNIILQPLCASVERDKEWEANREFCLALASECSGKDTKLLLVNQCRNQNGHLVRGVCSDGVEAAEWIDALNREIGKERFGFCLDVGNCNLCGQNIQEMTAALGKRIQAVILSENDGKNMARLLPFTAAVGRRSVLDWLGVIRGLREIDFDGYLILEAVDTTVSFSPLLQPCLVPVYREILDYFALQIHIERELKRYDRVALFGAGNMCRNYMKCYGEKYPPLFTCDNNPKLWGTEFEGLKVKPPESLKHLPDNCGVIICNIFYREIEAQLRSMGIRHIGYFNDEYMPSFYFDRLKRDPDISH